MRVGRVLCLGILLGIAGAARAKPIDDPFRRYPARPVDHASPTVIHGQDRLTRDNGDELLWTIGRNRMDAAGHFILAELGCATDCIRLAAVDALTGDVHWMPGTISSRPIKMLQPVLFRNDSRLVVVFGQLDERGPAGPFRFLLAADGFHPVPTARRCGTR